MGEDSMLEKQEHITDKEIHGSKTQLLSEKEEHANYDLTSDSCSGKGDMLNSSRPYFSVGSKSSKLVVEDGVHGVSCARPRTFFGNDYISSFVASDEMSKDCEIPIQQFSAKSDISSENELSVNIENCGFDIGRTPGYSLNAVHDNCKSIKHTTFHCAQQYNESSLSNHTHVSHPISSLNESFPVMSMEANSSKESSSSMSSSISSGLGYGEEKTVSENCVIDMAAKITKMAFDSASARDCKALGSELNSLIVENVNTSKCSLLKQKSSEPQDHQRKEHSFEVNGVSEAVCRIAVEIEQKFGIDGEASGCTPSLEDKISDVVNLNVVNFAKQSKRYGSSEARRGVKSHDIRDNYDSFFSSEKIMDLKKDLQAIQGQAEKLDPLVICGPNDGSHGKESSQLPAETQDDAMGYQHALFSRIDLNNAIHTYNIVNPGHLSNEKFPSHNVVRVLAKIGVPIFSQVASIKFEGELGWKGSATTSAFRSLLNSSNGSTVSSTNKNSCISRRSLGFTEIDLNIAANDDDPAVELPKKLVARSSVSFEGSSANTRSKRKQRLDIDLNCPDENGDDPCPSSLLVSSLSHFKVDFDLNDNPSLGDTWLSEGSQQLGSMVYDDASISFVGNSRQPNTNCVRPTCSVNLSFIPNLSCGPAPPFMASPPFLQPEEQMQGVVPLYPKLTNTAQQQMPQSHCFLYANPFSIEPADPQSSTNLSSGVLPCLKKSYAHTVTPQIQGFNSLPTFPASLHTMEVVNGRTYGDVTSIWPRTEIDNASTTSHNTMNGGYLRQYLISPNSLRQDQQMKPLEQVAMSITPSKRREPEGGRSSYRTDHRGVAPWH